MTSFPILRPVRKLIIPLLLWMALPGAALAQGPDCSKDPDGCIRLAAAEAAAYVDECGKTFPESKADLDNALARWNVRSLLIPRLEDAIKPGSPDRVALAKKAAVYLKSVGSYEREIECAGRFAMLKSREPKLYADFISLPRDPLERYIK
jgi:hypothetical protein